MKSLIFIVGLLVSSEIQFTLCKVEKSDSTSKTNKLLNDQTNENKSKLKRSGQNVQENTGLKNIEIVQDDEKKILPKSRSNKSSATVDGAPKNQGELISRIQDLREKAVSKHKQEEENAKLVLISVIKEVDSIRDKGIVERSKELQECHEQYKKLSSIARVIEKVAARNLEMAKERAEKIYNEQLKMLTKENLAAAAYEAADNKFEEEFEKIKEHKRKVETENQEAFEKANKEKETALEAAEKIREKAEENNRKALKSEEAKSPEGRAKIKAEYQEEIDKYDVALEKAENEWQKVLDTFGIGKEYEAALYTAVQELEQARQKAELISKTEIPEDEKQKALKEAELRKLEAGSLAEAKKSEANDECEEIRRNAENQVNICAKKAWRHWRNIANPAREQFKNANRAFSEAQSNATNALNETLAKANEMERELAEAATAKNIKPKKIVSKNNQRKQGTRRKSSATPKTEK